jgi:hypothetical protein
MREQYDAGGDEEIPDYVAERIRRPAPADSGIVPGSTPVVAFGDVRHAHVATLGLNPSRVEFHEHGVELDGPLRRFETLRSLEVSRTEDLSDEAVLRVWRRCNGYFHGNPYMKWFAPLEKVLAAAGASYFEGTACHLDLSQWATDPTWGGLPAAVRKRLTSQDVDFLLTQLTSEGISLLLLNGKGVVDAFHSVLKGELDTVGTISERSVTTKFYVGTFGLARVVGWSTNLQSSFGVTKELRAQLARRVSELAN